jgi:acetolactate synthase-1/2/3 large subunit
VNGGDRVAAVLQAQGVRFLFTLCGGHISPILVGCKARGIRVVDVRHEVNAVFAADAVARLTGVPGVAAVTAGPGATNTITAIKNAQLAQSPLVLLGGAAATVLRGRGSLQDIDQRALFAPHVKEVIEARRVRDLAPAVERAFAQAQAGVPGPVFVECPIDLLYEEPLVREWYIGKGAKPGASLVERAQSFYLKRHVARLFEGAGEPVSAAAAATASPPIPDGGSVAAAADRVARAERPVILVGSQSLLEAPAAAELAAAIEKLGVPVYLSGMARGLLGERHSLLMRHKRREALREADLVVLAGVPCDFRLDYGRHIRRSTHLISVNRSRADRNRNRRPSLGVDGDPGRFLRALAAAMSAPGGRWAGWLETLRRRDGEREAEIDRMSEATPDGGLNPVTVCRHLESALDAKSVIVADGGDFVATASYILNPRAPLSWLDPGVFGTLGVGAGFALGARLVRPEAEVWIVYGDGSAGYSLAEFDTFTRHGVPVIAVVGNDAGWTQIARDQIEILKDDVGTVLRRTDYHAVAEGFGGRGLLVDAPEKLGPALAEAKALARGGRAVLVNVHLGRTDFRKGSISM